MSTGSIQLIPKRLMTYRSDEGFLVLTLKNNTVTLIKAGTFVKLTATDSIEPAMDTDIPVGYAYTDIAPDGEQGAVVTNYRAVVTAQNAVAAMASGDEATLGVVNASGYYDVVAGIATKVVHGIVLRGAAQDVDMLIGLLANPYIKA